MMKQTEQDRISSLDRETMTEEDAWEVVRQPEAFHLDTRKIACDVISAKSKSL
jgi:hypothetical protein